jgi:hypothetical protein
MSFDGVLANKLNGGLGRRSANEDNIMILVVGMALTGTSVVLYEPKRLIQLEDAEALGIDSSYDANENAMVHNDIREFFEYCPDGELYLMPVAEGLTPTALCDSNDFIAAVRSVPVAKSIGISNTLNDVTDTHTFVDAVQKFVNDFSEEHRYIDAVILEGKGEVGVITPIANYPDLRAKNAPNVSVSIVQDPKVAIIGAANAKRASIGSILGMIGVRQVNENIGAVDILNKPTGKKGNQDYPLTVLGTGHFASAQLSDGRPFAELSSAERKTLTASGYIYAGGFAGYGGVFLNGSPTCVDIANDYAYIENNRVWNKAMRIIRETLIPKVRGIVKKDATTGFIRSTTISDWQSRLNKALEIMIVDNEISGFDFYINPKQTLAEDSPLQIKGNLAVDGIVFDFEMNLGLTDQL